MSDAGTRLREYLAAHGIEVTEVRPLSFTKLAAFSVTEQSGRAVSAIVEGESVWLDPKPGLDVVGQILKAGDFLTRRDLGPNDLIFLVTSFGIVPTEIAGFGSYRQTKSVAGYPARLEFNDAGAQLELVVPRTTGRRGTTAKPSEPVYKARLVISPRYAIHWTIEAAEVPPVDKE